MTDTSFALYRKYRPHTFEAVRNQDHITSVLEGAIKKGMIPHALIFTGARGTGKTTVARIFAHALGVRDVDLYEIDAASNRGIDDIRALRESVLTLPYDSPYKVYIIDEVHMLTKEAWNALLKTLEEPPSYVVFMLATTEVDRIPETITSRCQVFRFRSPTRGELTELVLDVATRESLTVTEAGASIIALAANGSYRDALSIMQKVLMASGDATLEHDEIARIVGAPRIELIRRFIEALGARNSAEALGVIGEVSGANLDMSIFLTLVLERLRLILLIRHGARTKDALTELGDEERPLVERIAQERTSPINAQLLLRFLVASDQIPHAFQKALPLELAVIETIG